MYPDRFEGVDDQMIQQIMDASVRQCMHPATLEDPNMWAGAAWIAKGAQTGYKMTPPATPQMNPNPSETPTAARPTEDKEIPDIRGDALTEELLKYRPEGVTKEEFLEEVQAIREGEGR